MTRTYRVVVQYAPDGRKQAYTVQADSEADAILAAKQSARHAGHLNIGRKPVATRAVPISKERNR